MVKKDLEQKIEIPPGITLIQEGKWLSFKGQNGIVKRRFDNPGVEIEVSESHIKVSLKKSGRKEKAVYQSYIVHIRNAFAGIMTPYVYTLKVCSGHFPMNVSVSGKTLMIKNFLGEKVPRQVLLKEGVVVKVEGNIIYVESPDKELAGQVAADIEQATRRPGFDRRIFQDGIYITEKAGHRE